MSDPSGETRPTPAPLAYLVLVAAVVLFARWMREHVPEPMIDERHLGRWSPAQGTGEFTFTMEHAPDAFGYDVHRGAFAAHGVSGWPEAEGAWRYRSLVPLRLTLQMPSGALDVSVAHADSVHMDLVPPEGSHPALHLVRTD